MFKTYFELSAPRKCLALPKDPQSVCPYVAKAKKNIFRIFQFFFYYTQIMQGFHNFFFKKIQSVNSGWNSHRLHFHPLGDHRMMELCILSSKGIFVTAIAPTWIFLTSQKLWRSLGKAKHWKKNSEHFFIINFTHITRICPKILHFLHF